MSNCHNSQHKQGGYDFTNYEGIMRGVKAKHPLRSEVYTSIRGNAPDMPQRPYPKLSSKQVQLIKLWINAGARNTSGCSSCDSTSYSYSGSVAVIMNTWCTGCHSSTSASGNIDLSNYAGVVQAANGNRLLGSVQHQPGYIAMPENGGRLSDCEIRLIEKWIVSGFPQD